MSDERAAGTRSIFGFLAVGLFLSAVVIGCDAPKGACASDGECAATERCDVPAGACLPKGLQDGGTVDAGASQALDAAPDGAKSPDAAAGSPPYYPFGSRLDGSYPFGIKVSGHSNTQMDAMVGTSYDAWKSVRLRAAVRRMRWVRRPAPTST